MIIHEEREFNGPLREFLEETKQYRVASIYNYEYKYIKEIIWDTERQEKYGNTRAGYDKFKEERNNTSVDFGGVYSLRAVRDRDTDKAVGYIVEKENKDNYNLGKLFEIYNRARAEIYNILDVKDKEAFDYFIDKNIINEEFKLSANGLVQRIKDLEDMIEEYNSDEFYKRYIDKIKG